MANIYSTGPAHIFIGRMPNDTEAEFIAANMFYLGTFEGSPKITINNLSEDVMNDIGGDAPISKSTLGQTANIQGVLNRYDEAVYQKLSGGLYGTTNRGISTKEHIGALAQTMGFDFDVLMYFPFASRFTVDDTPYVPPEGLHFVSVVPQGPDKLIDMGTSARKIEINLMAIPKRKATATQSSNTNDTNNVFEFVLYKHIATVAAALKGLVN